jgi:hypothetical protein
MRKATVCRYYLLSHRQGLVFLAVTDPAQHRAIMRLTPPDHSRKSRARGAHHERAKRGAHRVTETAIFIVIAKSCSQLTAGPEGIFQSNVRG